MKKTVLSTILGVSFAGVMYSTAAVAGLTGNVGIMSDYYFRGLNQSDATASAGVDYDVNDNVSIGIWAADVGGQTGSGGGTAQGIEYDLYGAYSGTYQDFGYSVGGTIYLYTGVFDTQYTEINLGGTYDMFAVDYAIGTRDGGTGGTDTDYTFLSLTAEYMGGYATYGLWGDQAEGAYLELGYGVEAGGMDLGVALINGDPDTGAGNIPGDGTALTFSLSKSFDIK